MRRPEGYDTPQEAPVAPTPAKTPRAAKPGTATNATAKKSAQPQPAPREKPARPARVRRPSADRTARAELHAAERARKRAEKQELRRFTRHARRRRIGWLVGIGLTLALVGLSIAAVYSPMLALREIRVEGTTTLDPAAIVDAVDGQLGVPLALLDEERLEEELGEFRLIRSYTTELLPPSTLIVRIAERTPVGAVQTGGQFDLIDPAGVVVSSSPERPAGYPIVHVAEVGVESVAFASVAEVLVTLPAELRAQVDSIAATTRDDVTFVLAGSTQRVEWGSADRSDHKARVLSALLAMHGGAGPGLYDVTAPGTAVFRAD